MLFNSSKVVSLLYTMMHGDPWSTHHVAGVALAICHVGQGGSSHQ